MGRAIRETVRGAIRGTVYLVGAGPGDPELLTVRAAGLIADAECILHDDLVSDAVLELAGSEAMVRNVGKRCGPKSITQTEINRLLVELARAGHSVVRLKSGDPMLYGRAGEELETLRGAGVAHEVVPGISAAFAAAAAAGVSLTDRRGAARVILATGHHSREEPMHFGGMKNASVALYMPGKDYGRLAAELMRDGWAADAVCHIVSHASCGSQVIGSSTLGELGGMATVAAPAILLIVPPAQEK